MTKSLAMAIANDLSFTLVYACSSVHRVVVVARAYRLKGYYKRELFIPSSEVGAQRKQIRCGLPKFLSRIAWHFDEESPGSC